MVKLIGKNDICSNWANFCKTRPGLPSENQQKCPILVTFCAIYPKQSRWPPNFFFAHFIDKLMISNTWKNYKNLSTETLNIIENIFINAKSSPFMCVTIVTFLCPFLLESPRLNKKLLWKLWINLIALFHISNGNTAYLFEILKRIYRVLGNGGPNTCFVSLRELRLISFSSQKRSGTPPFFPGVSRPCGRSFCGGQMPGPPIHPINIQNY